MQRITGSPAERERQILELQPPGGHRFAVTAVGLGIVSWAVAGTDDLRVRRALAVALAIAFGLNIVVGIIKSANGVMNNRGWGFVLCAASPGTGASG